MFPFRQLIKVFIAQGCKRLAVISAPTAYEVLTTRSSLDHTQDPSLLTGLDLHMAFSGVNSAVVGADCIRYHGTILYRRTNALS